jgi:hypothetical protein
MCRVYLFNNGTFGPVLSTPSRTEAITLCHELLNAGEYAYWTCSWQSYG